jgi:hemolysin activation/secretion protein
LIIGQNNELSFNFAIASSLFQRLTKVRVINILVFSIIGCILFCSPKAQANPAQSLPATSVPGTIVVSKFEIIGNKVIPSAAIDRVIKPYLFRPISFIELLELQRAITKLYIEQGYVTSGAFIPPQTIKDRTIKIKIIPGTVEEINISGLKRLKSGYIRSRLAIATSPPLNQNKLLNALQLLQLDPLITNISAELSKGINPGGSFLEIEIEEADTFSLGLSIDNQKSPNVGSVRRQVSISQNNLVGWGDRFNVSYVNTDGSNSLEDLSYVIPLNAHNGEIRLAHSRSNSQIITESFAELDIETKNRYYEATYLQPLYQTPTRNVTAGVIFSRQNAENSLRNFPYPLSRGADSEGKTNISALHFFQEFSDRNYHQVFAARSEFSIGIDAFDATINNNLPDSKFLVWRGQAQYLRLLNPNTSIFLRSDLQLADRPLVPLEQFSSGGALSVRGYSQDSILGDNGLFFSAELRNTVLRVPKWNLSLELSPFFDFGEVWNSDDVRLETNTLSSLGVGLQLLVGDDLTARLDWGFPLIKVDSLGDSLQENGIHFSLEAKPF